MRMSKVKKNNNRRLAFVLGVVFLALPLRAATTEPSAEKLVALYLKAAGGGRAIKELSGVKMEGRLSTADGKTGTFTLITQRPDQLYEEVIIGANRESEAYNGKSAWRLDSSHGLQTLTGDAGSWLKADALFLNDQLSNSRKMTAHVRSAGSETVRGHTAFAIELTDAAGRVRKIWFDARTHLIRQQQQERPNGRIVVYGDYRKVGGVAEPYYMQVSQPSQTFSVQFDSVEPSAAVDSSVFNFPSVSNEPLPDIPTLLRELDKNQAAIDKILESYTYHESDTQIEYNKDGSIKKQEERTYEIYQLGDRQVRKLIAKDGKPLSAADQKKEDERVAKVARKYEQKLKNQAGHPEKAAKEKKDQEAGIADFLRVDQFTNPRRELFQGRPVIVFDFGPKPGYKPKNLTEKLIQKLVGVAWVDENAHDVARLEAHFSKGFKLAGGLLATVQPGSAFVFEQKLVNNEVWLPVYAEAHASVRFLLLAGVNMSDVSHFSNYRKFQVSTDLKTLTSGAAHPKHD